MPDKLAFSAPSAFITVNGKPAGYVQNIQATENYQRVDVRGIGNLFAVEVPVVAASVSFTIGMIYIDFDLPFMKAMVDRSGGAKALKDTFSLNDLPFAITIYKKKVRTMSGNLVTEVDAAGEQVVPLRDCYLDNQSWSLAEGGLAMTNASGRAITPITK